MKTGSGEKWENMFPEFKSMTPTEVTENEFQNDEILEGSPKTLSLL